MAPTTDYTVTITWALGTFFYKNLYYLVLLLFFLGLNAYKLWTTMAAGTDGKGRGLETQMCLERQVLFFHLDYTNDYLQTVTATTITGVSGVVTVAPGSSSSRGSKQCISSPRYGFFNLFIQVIFFSPSLFFADASYNYVSTTSLSRMRGGGF